MIGRGLLRRFQSLVPGARFMHSVHHNPRKGVFYVNLDLDLDKRAVLTYKVVSGQFMDLLGINVPELYKGQGIARLLTETAFTYAIMNDYYLYLTCSYAQKYYLANRNTDLDRRIVGPKKILGVPVAWDQDHLDKEPDPEDPISGSKKN